MTDRASLLAAIVAAPDDPLPRLVFADYLDDTGDSDWAELIRLQNGYFTDWTNRPEMKAREAELIAATADRFPAVPGVELGPPVRGFPEVAYFVVPNGADYDDGAAANLIARLPVTWFHFRHPPGRHLGPEVYRLLSARARVVELPPFTEVDEVVAILDAVSPSLLRVFGWRYAGVDDEDAVGLAAAPSLAGLEELYLPGNNIGQDGADALAASPHLRNLRMLDLCLNAAYFDTRGLERRFGPALRLA